MAQASRLAPFLLEFEVAMGWMMVVPALSLALAAFFFACVSVPIATRTSRLGACVLPQRSRKDSAESAEKIGRLTSSVLSEGQHWKRHGYEEQDSRSPVQPFPGMVYPVAED